MAFLTDQCRRFPLTASIIDACRPFSCGDKDLDEFFRRDYDDYQKQLMGKTYVFLERATMEDIVCAFTVSNASIFTNFLPNARKKKVGKDVPLAKRDLIYPAVLIGRLGVNQKYLHRHVADCTKFREAQKRREKNAHPKCRRRGVAPRIPKAVGPKTQYAILRQVITLTRVSRFFAPYHTSPFRF